MKSVKFIDVTLNPLREKGFDALDVHDIPGLEKAELEALKAEQTDDTHWIFTAEADDMPSWPAPFPKTAILITARLLLHFASTIRTALVEIHPPDTITYDPDCPLSLIARFLLKRGFAKDILL